MPEIESATDVLVFDIDVVLSNDEPSYRECRAIARRAVDDAAAGEAIYEWIKAQFLQEGLNLDGRSIPAELVKQLLSPGTGTWRRIGEVFRAE